MSTGRPHDTQEGHAAADALLRDEAVPRPLLPGAGPDAWLAFEQRIRHAGRMPLLPDPEVRLCHPSGYVREEALGEAALGGAPAPPELIAIRTADWVWPVRERARRLLDRALAADPVGTLTALTPLVLRLGRREQGAWVLKRFETALRTEPGSASVVLAAHTALHDSADPPTRRFAARLTVAAGGTGVRELARRAAGEPDPATARLWTDAALRALATDGPDHEAIDTLLDGHGPMVRAAGVTALRGAGRAGEAGRHLTDRSGLVRACARWLVSQGGGDPSARYLALVTAPGPLSPYAVTGFSECAKRADTPLLRSLLDHPHGAVRAAAVAGLRRLDDATDDTLLLPLLDDPSASVAREAALSLLPVARRLDHGHLSERLGHERPPHVRRSAFRLLRARDGIDGLRAAVTVATDPDPALRTMARAVVVGWNWQATLRLGDADLPELAGLLERSAHLFGDHELGVRRSRLGLTD
ncbi:MULTISPECIES: HEAT repeat domain-containing protein [unclassified Streptomyces]|uniref:HEAT repeat domain-containing protein n=1 Tax=unclassified Streptomyces TaxID=2593676 RepID=UPI000DC7DF38|nr:MULTISPECIES: HEAT repeat domain-containing protein [unclassified Streptomyces]AWZ04123.1 hypothetical protein DRB89_05205 [Streptomyces sp. ICC4]AWZ11698.1 hypothetical protein DRB96_04530 [Streptomyces sp. ICC1]